MVRIKIVSGDVFILPLDENDNYGVGRVLLSKSPALFVEFYRKVVRVNFDIANLKNEEVLYVQKCGNLGFKLKEWKVVGNIPVVDEYDPLSHYWWHNKLGQYYLRKYGDFDKKNLYLSDFEDIPSSLDEIKRLKAHPVGAAGHIYAKNYLRRMLEEEGIYNPPLLDKQTDSVKTVSVEKPFGKNNKNKDYPFSVDGNTISANLEREDLYEKHYKLFEKYDIEGNGYAWEGLIKQILGKENPALLGHIEFDPEGSSFYAYADSEKTRKEFIKIIAPIFSDIHKLESWLKKIDKDLLDD